MSTFQTRDLLSGPDQSGDGLGRFFDLAVGLIATRRGRLYNAVVQVLIEQAQGNRPQRARHRRDLGQDVDAILLVFHHLLEASGLTLDAPQTIEIGVLVGEVTGMACRVLHQLSLLYPPRVYHTGTSFPQSLWVGPGIWYGVQHEDGR